MSFNFRLRFDFVEGHFLNSGDDHVDLDHMPSGEVLTLYPGGTGQSWAAIFGGPYPSQQLAQEAAEYTRDTLLIWAVRRGFGVDVGAGHVPSGMLVEGGRAAIEKFSSLPVRGDIQGIDVYPAAGDTHFVRVGSKCGTITSVDGFVMEFRQIRAGAWRLSAKQRLASELFSASLFDRVQRSRFITLVTAVEAILEPRGRNSEVQSIIDHARVLADSLPKSEPAKESLISGLENLRKDSIGQSGRRLAEQLLKGKSYDGLPPGNFFSKCYSIRSQTVHRGMPDDPNVNFLMLANSCQQFVGDLLLASLEVAAQQAVEPADPAAETS